MYRSIYIPFEEWEFLVVRIKDVDLTVTIMLHVKLMILLVYIYMRDMQYNYFMTCDTYMYNYHNMYMEDIALGYIMCDNNVYTVHKSCLLNNCTKY